jgi:hypothetical protein
LRQIGDHDEPPLAEELGADGLFERRLAQAQPDFGFEPLTPVLDEADEGNRNRAGSRGQLREFVEFRLAGRVENAIAPQSGKPVFFVPGGIRFFVEH